MIFILFFIGRYSGFLKEKKIKENDGDKNKRKKKSKKDDVVLTPIVSLTSIISALRNLEGKAKVCASCPFVCERELLSLCESVCSQSSEENNCYFTKFVDFFQFSILFLF